MPRLDRADVTYSSSPSMELPERLPGVSVPPLTVTLTTDTPNSSDAADLWPNFWARTSNHPPIFAPRPRLGDPDIR